jgi:hypothetical protein
MKRYKKAFLIFLISAMITGTMNPNLFAGEKWEKNDPTTDEWNTIDLMIARPLGVAAAIGGLGIFSISLPFTITVDIFSRIKGEPSSAVKDAAKMLILNPLKFSFTREFPDENM